MSPAVITGRVHAADASAVWYSVGPSLNLSLDGGSTVAARWHARTGGARDLTMRSRLAKRLFRSGVHHVLPIGEERALGIVNGSIVEFSTSRPRVTVLEEVRGSRPLSLERGPDLVVYGEYRRNDERSRVHVWGCDVARPSRWRALWSFEHVRHVHGVFYDPFWQAYWVTTGDEDHESALWVSRDSFRSLEQVVAGTQQTRAVRLLFARDHVFFGSDAPNEDNNIYALSRDTGELVSVARVGGPVFHGASLGRTLLFSTVVEPCTHNHSRQADVIAVHVADLRAEVIASFEKDRWHPRWFQYGQVLFSWTPAGSDEVWLTPFATESDHVSYKVQNSASGSWRIRTQPMAATGGPS